MSADDQLHETAIKVFLDDTEEYIAKVNGLSTALADDYVLTALVLKVFAEYVGDSAKTVVEGVRS